MKKQAVLAALAAFALCAPVLAGAQEPVTPTPSTFVAWDAVPADQGVTHYTLYADDAEVAQVTETQVAFPALTPGQHVLEVTATNQVAESERSMALVVLVIVTAPDSPGNLRIITARWTPATGWVPTWEVV